MVCFPFRAHHLAAAHRTLRRHVKRLMPARMVFIFYNPDNLRDHIAAALDFHPIADFHAQPLDFIHVVERRPAHRCSANRHRLQRRNWREFSRASNVEIFDTAGRQEIDSALIEEIKQLKEFLKPQEVLLVADAATGQQAVSVATHFHEALGITGIVLTKLDGDARGGAALSMREVTQRPIKFAGVGEKLDQFEPFVPDRLAGRILGMGDIVGLVEKAAQAIDEEEAARMEEKLRTASFDFNDFLAQFKMMRKLGPLESILGMLPGLGNMQGLNIDEKQLKRTEAIVLSMTNEERKRPDILNARRRPGNGGRDSACGKVD